MLTSSRNVLAFALIKFDDEWLKIHGADGRTCDASSRVEMLYPPTRAHLALILSMLHVYEGTVHHPKTTLPAVPSLLVLHELSALCTATSPEPTLASYLSLISHALTVAKTLSIQAATHVTLVVFDSGLDKLRLPILRPVSPTSEGAPGSSQARLEHVSFFVEKYFELVGTVEALPAPEIPSSQPEEDSFETAGEHMRMAFRRTGDSSMDLTWDWVVRKRMDGIHPGGKYFDWT